MAESFDIWKLHLVYRLSRIPPGFDEDVLGKVRAIEGVTSVTVVLSNNTTTHLAFSTRYAHAVVAAVAAKKCLQEAIDAHNATLWLWQRKVRLVDEPAVRKVGEAHVSCAVPCAPPATVPSQPAPLAERQAAGTSPVTDKRAPAWVFARVATQEAFLPQRFVLFLLAKTPPNTPFLKRANTLQAFGGKFPETSIPKIAGKEIRAEWLSSRKPVRYDLSTSRNWRRGCTSCALRSCLVTDAGLWLEGWALRVPLLAGKRGEGGVAVGQPHWVIRPRLRSCRVEPRTCRPVQLCPRPTPFYAGHRPVFGPPPRPGPPPGQVGHTPLEAV